MYQLKLLFLIYVNYLEFSLFLLQLLQLTTNIEFNHYQLLVNGEKMRLDIA